MQGSFRATDADPEGKYQTKEAGREKPAGINTATLQTTSFQWLGDHGRDVRRNHSKEHNRPHPRGGRSKAKEILNGGDLLNSVRNSVKCVLYFGHAS